MSLTERQQKWFASVQASLERETGKTIEEWVAIARACPETRPRARQAWLKQHHGLGVNRASYVLSQAFPSGMDWNEEAKLRALLWADPESTRILEAVEAAVTGLPDLVSGQRKGFTAFSRKVQFAAIRPVKGGGAWLGLALEAAADPRLEPAKNDGWSERLHARLALKSPAEVDGRVVELLKAAWDRS